MATFNGTSGDDVYGGTTSADTINGNGGADLLFGDAGNDTMNGGTGDDLVLGGTGADNLNGGDNNDVVADNDIFFDGVLAFPIVDAVQDFVNGGAGDDFLLGGLSDVFDGGTGIDSAMIDLGAASGVTVNLTALNNGLTATLPSGGSIRNVEGGIAMFFGAGNNTAFGSQFVEEMYGWTGNDNFDGGAGDDFLDGWSGNDTLAGGAGADTIDGGEGNDQIAGGAGNDVITSELGVDSVDGGADNDYASINRSTASANLAISTAAMASAAGQTWADGTFVANLERFDLVTGSGADSLQLDGPLLAAASFNGGAGLDRLIADLSSSTDNLSVSTSLLTWGFALTMSNIEALTVQTGSGADTITSGIGDDVIHSGAGDDVINVGAGAASVNGGDGVDALTINRSAAAVGLTITSAGMALAGGETWADGTFIAGIERFNITAGSGNDLLTLHDPLNLTSSSFHGGAGTDRIVADYSASSANLDISPNQLGGANFIISGIEELHVSTGSGADTIRGATGDDILNGGGGNDRFWSSTGTDILDGGEGTDHIALDASAATQNLVFDFAAFRTATGATVNGWTVRNFETFEAWGGSGNDLFDGLGIDGERFLFGGAGFDRVNFIFTTSGQLYFANSIVMTSAGRWTLNGIESVQLNGGDANDFVSASQFQVFLNAFGGDDDITTGDFADTIDAGAGGDFVSAGGGNDTVWGGGDTDQLEGGNGADWIDGGEGNDVVNGGAGSDTLLGGDGDDEVQSVHDAAADVMDGGDGHDNVYIDRTASSAAYVLRTSEMLSATGTTLVDGSVIRNMERFSFIGGSGNDTLHVDGAIIGHNQFFGGDGVDTVVADFSSLTSPIRLNTNSIQGGTINNGVYEMTLVAFVEQFNIVGTAQADFLFSWIGDDVLSGGGGNDNIFGAEGADTLNGGDGNDSINGGLGLDTMSGGAGDDTYTAWETGDVIVEAFGEGLDVVQAWQDYTLSDNVENLQLQGGGSSSALIGIGNAIDNQIDGNSQNNVLSGLGGNDFLVGQSGLDTLNGGEGNDRLDGGAGNDQMTGGAGDDTYRVEDAGDVVVETADGGVDTVEALVNHTMAANVENMTLMFNATTGVGNGLDNVINGTSLSNTLSGLAGADTLNGGEGADTLIGGFSADQVNGGAGNDTINYAIGDGADTIDGGADADTLSLTDGASGNLLNAAYDGSTLTALAGSSLANLETINANMGGGVDWLIYAPASAGVTVDLAAGSASGFTSIAGIERVIGGNGDDALTGDSLDNRLEGGVGADTLSGAGGIDAIFGGDGADLIAGGLGNDSLQGNAGEDTFNWSYTDGRDTFNGGADSDTLNMTGAGVNEIAYANWNGTSLTGLWDNAFADAIEAINIDMSGGNDWLIYNTTFAVTVNLALGTGSGFASVANVERVIGGAGDDALTGDELGNRLEGGIGADTLSGGGGIDAIFGGDGADILDGGAANDSLDGGAGDDIFNWAMADGRDTFRGGADTDTLNMTGSGVNDVARANWNGSAITGLLDNSLTDIEEIHLDLGAGGSVGDWLQYNTTFGVAVDLAAGTATGFASIASVENIIGGTGGDTLTGDGASNKILGGDGDDIISGGGAGDNLSGGLGSDTFVYAAGAGNDTINDFDAWADGGQDVLDVSAFGIDAGNFASRVAIIDTGADTVVRIDDTYFITLKNVSGDGDNVITSEDFLFA